MNRLVLLVSAAALAVSAALVSGTTVLPVKALAKIPLPAFGSRTFDIHFVGSQRAAVMCFPSGKAYVGLYVFDPQGNCVAHDDIAPSRPIRDAESAEKYYCDDCGVVWYPADSSICTIDVISLGKTANTFTLAAK